MLLVPILNIDNFPEFQSISKCKPLKIQLDLEIMPQWPQWWKVKRQSDFESNQKMRPNELRNSLIYKGKGDLLLTCF